MVGFPSGEPSDVISFHAVFVTLPVSTLSTPGGLCPPSWDRSSPPAPVLAASLTLKESGFSEKIHVVDMLLPGTRAIHFSFQHDVKSRVLFPVWTWSSE